MRRILRMAKKLRDLGIDPDTLAPLGMTGSFHLPPLEPISQLQAAVVDDCVPPPADEEPTETSIEDRARQAALQALIRGTVDTIRAQRHAIQSSFTVPRGETPKE
jgi:hypothetical protein